MNYRHAFHAGNHADVLKHTVLLSLLDALTRKETPIFALDTHAGRGSYALNASAAQRSGEADSGFTRLKREYRGDQASVQRYLRAVADYRAESTEALYPGSPLLLARSLREQDRVACCELQEEEASTLRQLLRGDSRVGVHHRDGYAAMSSLLPPKEKRGLVLIDPPYEAQLAEFDAIVPAIRAGLGRWATGVFALWYPIKLRRSLQPFFRRAADLPASSVLVAELLVRRDDSPLRLNGSGMLIVNPPWQLDSELKRALPALLEVLDEGGGSCRIEWLRESK